MLLGRKIIKYPFTPRLSPKKSWEGFIIAYVLTAIFILVYGYFLKIFDLTSSPTAWLIVAAIVLPVACQVGDLFFSSIKRTKKIKDFSSIIPGHGGLVDRIDGLIFVVIIFATIYGVSLIGMVGIN
jgi:phosphatidate cytidylyltransferase